MAAMAIALLQVAPVSAQGLPGLPQAVVPSAVGSAPTASTAAPSPTNWADRLAEARAEQERLQADPDAPAGAERRRALSRLIALLASRVERAQAPTPKTSAEAQSSVAVTLRGEPPYAVPEVDALRDQRDSLQAQQVALALTLKSLDSELEAASQVHRKAAETLEQGVEISSANAQAHYHLAREMEKPSRLPLRAAEVRRPGQPVQRAFRHSQGQPLPAPAVLRWQLASCLSANGRSARSVVRAPGAPARHGTVRPGV